MINRASLTADLKSVNIVSYLDKSDSIVMNISKLELSTCKRLALFVYLVTDK